MANTYSAGIATAYGAAVRGGYTGTYDDFCRQQAEYAESAAAVEQAKADAETAADAAEASKTAAAGSASAAATSAGQASTSATNAANSATAANASKNAAATSATEAGNFATAAAGSAATAQGVLESIPPSYDDLADEVADLKEDLNDSHNFFMEQFEDVVGIPHNYIDCNDFSISHTGNWGISTTFNSITITHKTSYTTGAPTIRFYVPAGHYVFNADFSGASFNSFSLYDDNGTWIKALSDGTLFQPTTDAYWKLVGGQSGQTTETVSNISLVLEVAPNNIDILEAKASVAETEIDNCKDSVLSGKIAFDNTKYEKGSLTNGVPDNYQIQARVRSKNLEHNEYDLTIVADTNWKFFITYFTSDGVFQSVSSWQYGQVVIEKGTYYKLVFTHDTDTSTRTLADIMSHYKMLTYREETDAVPDYYFASDYLPNKALSIIENAPSDGVSFAFITDVHVNLNAGRSPLLLKYLEDNTNSLSFVMFGGDVPMDRATLSEVKQQAITWQNWMSKIGKASVYQMLGNHDYKGLVEEGGELVNYSLSEGQIYSLLMGNQFFKIKAPSNRRYYYFDIDALKTRIIVVDCYDNDNNFPTMQGRVGISTEQLSWIANTALSRIDGYRVILFSHEASDADMPYYASKLADLQSLIVAFANKTTFSSGGVSKDFTGDTNTFVVHISGHAHSDANVTNDGVLNVATTCDSRYNGVSEDYRRVVGTTTEQAFDIFSIDYTNRTVKTVRIGFGNDRNFTY